MSINHIRHILFNLLARIIPTKKVFTNIYKNRKWGEGVSVSGPGSDLTQTSEILKKIPILLKKIKAKTLLDVPCGDFFWMQHVKFNLDKYIGADIVSELVDTNNKKFGNKKIEFIEKDVIKDKLPKVDVILCRDCLVHFSTANIKKTINNFKKSGSVYLLTTTFLRHNHNPNILTGHWRPIDLQSPPFNFPPPLETIQENCTEVNGKFSDKSLALWRLSNLPTNNYQSIFK